MYCNGDFLNNMMHQYLICLFVGKQISYISQVHLKFRYDFLC